MENSQKIINKLVTLFDSLQKEQQGPMVLDAEHVKGLVSSITNPAPEVAYNYIQSAVQYHLKHHGAVIIYCSINHSVPYNKGRGMMAFEDPEIVQAHNGYQDMYEPTDIPELFIMHEEN